MLKNILRPLTVLSISLCLCACATSQYNGLAESSKRNDSLITNSALGQRLPDFNRTLFKAQSVISRAEITALSEQQKADFFIFFNNPKYGGLGEHERVATYLGLLLDQFSYSDETLTAEQSLKPMAGNCLSLTVLTTAFAELVDVDLSYQLLDQNPVYSINNSLLITSNHLRAVLQNKPHIEEVFSKISRVRIDFFETDGLSFIDNISTDFQISLFYSNLAIEQLANNSLDMAFAHASKALEVYPYNPSALNVVGVVHRKKGDLAKAEEIYRHGAKYFFDAPTFLNNYAALLKSQSRGLELAELFQEASKNPNNHPWAWVRAGREAYQKGNYSQAINHYQRALEIAPDVHEIYAFASAASYAAGDDIATRNFLGQAFNLAREDRQGKLYKGKLRALK